MRRAGCLLLGAACASRLALDLVTVDRTAPQGVPLLWPISHDAFIAPVTIFQDLHHGASWDAFVNGHNAIAVLIEAVVNSAITVVVGAVADLHLGELLVVARAGLSVDTRRLARPADADGRRSRRTRVARRQVAVDRVVAVVIHVVADVERARIHLSVAIVAVASA
jgi:hypothetical protein